MPTQSSLAAGVLQTVMRVSISIGLAISAAVYGSVAQTPKGRENANLPFERAYLCSLMFAVVGLLFVPFMKIERQGTKCQPPSFTGTKIVDEDRPRTGGEYSDRLSTESHRRIISNKPSQTSLWSSATAGSVDSFFPRWSWEPEIAWPDDRYQHRNANVVYEVCIKCLDERVVVVQPHSVDAGHRPETLDPNPYRCIEESSYRDPNGPAVDENPCNLEGYYVGRDAGISRFSSTETLLANTYANSRPSSSRPPSRAPSRRGLSSGDATTIRYGIMSSNFSSAETLHPHTHEPMLHRTPSRREPTPFSSNPPLSSFPAPPQRSSTSLILNEDVRMSGARLDGSETRSVDSRDPMYRVSRGGRGWV
jgi:hypothetical protein